MKKVYFAGSIRGGREDVLLYQSIIDTLKKNCIVLTEHIGNPSLKESISDKEIYERDIALLEESQLIIAECTTPSLGVGYELSYAERINKEIHVFYNKNRTSLSAMISGDDYFHVHPYGEEKELFELLKSIILP